MFQYTPIGLIAGPANFAFEATTIVVDGVMFLTGPDAHVWALDAATGEMLWHYHHAIPLDVPLCCGNVNRGVAIANGRVFFVTPTGHLVALDGTTGKPVWDTTFAEMRAGESATLAPLALKNLLIVGSSGGEYGARGHIDAFDQATGQPGGDATPCRSPASPAARRGAAIRGSAAAARPGSPAPSTPS